MRLGHDPSEEDCSRVNRVANPAANPLSTRVLASVSILRRHSPPDINIQFEFNRVAIYDLCQELTGTTLLHTLSWKRLRDEAGRCFEACGRRII